MEQMYITDLHLQHTEWKNTLLFYVDDIKTLDHRLQEVLSKNNDKEVLAMAEHFQNQLMLQKNRAAEILHSIKESLNLVEAEVNNHPVATDHRKMELNSTLRDEVADYVTHFSELRHEAIRFFSKWM
jgi:6-pyruvoyl-tetrahydropterin synthase